MLDDDCDGSMDEHYLPYYCGTGGCRRASTCVGGFVSCTPGTPGTDNDCDAVDDDCDGSTDEHWIPPTCGIGACQRLAICVGGVQSCTPGSPTGTDNDCDGVDDDCDGGIDESYAPYYCGTGVCRRASTCAGGFESCTPGSPTGSDNNCNGLDEDCDSTSDEHYVPTTCGVGVCVRTSTCVGGVASCTPGTPTGTDANCNSLDEDCDGTSDEHYVPTYCGTGACRRASTCVGGFESCTPGTSTPDTDCDGVDDDCDTVPDDNYITYTCGLGACQRSSTCVGGVQSCTPGTPGVDDDCDNVDDDCDGTKDEHYAPYYCGIGACRRTSTCSGGVQSCSPGSPTGDDSDCDNVDDDCDSLTDEHWVTYYCGVGACRRSATCVGGVASCTPGSTTGPDTDCDAIDDDCDGSADEHYAPYTCGLGVCLRSSTCTGGVQSCTPGSPTGTDSTCNGVNEDCDGSTDEHWVAYTCGVGPCLRTATCVGGVASCTPGTPGTEVCNGIDDDCNGTVDNGTPTALCGTIAHATPQCVAGVCSIASCESGYYDMDTLFSTGCECGEDSYEASGGDTCLAAVGLGTIADNPGGYITVTGNIAPSGDEDWYVVSATDDTDTTGDEYYVEAYFQTNPGGLVLDVYKGSCSDSSPCTGVADCFNWYTDFFDGSLGEWGCGSGQLNSCSDNSKSYYIRVRRASGSASCSNYTLRISNNPSSVGTGCTHFDSCPSATTLAQNATTSGTMSGENNSSVGSCGGRGGPDKIYQLVLSSASDVFIAAFSTAFDPVLYVSPYCGLSTSGCNDNAYSGVQSSVLIFDNLAAGTYYVTVDSKAATTGSFSVEVYVNANKVAGDTCGQPFQLQNGASGSTCSFTNDYTPSCSSSSAADTVFYFIKQAAGAVYTDQCYYAVDHVGSYRDICTQNSPETLCDDDGCGSTYGPILSTTLAAGVHFFILDGFSTTCGSYLLYVSGA